VSQLKAKNTLEFAIIDCTSKVLRLQKTIIATVRISFKTLLNTLKNTLCRIVLTINVSIIEITSFRINCQSFFESNFKLKLKPQIVILKELISKNAHKAEYINVKSQT
jgi:hypothetical protein